MGISQIIVAMPDYNPVAPFYDPLKNLVFGHSLVKAQGNFLNHILPKGSVLIVGGGSGQILVQLEKLGFNGSVDFVEFSHKMLQIARKRKITYLVRFHQQNIFEFRPDHSYDSIITSFFLDQFNGNRIDSLIKKLIPHLKNGGKWIETDFVASSRLNHQILLKLMYWFFHRLVGIEAKELNPPDSIFEKNLFVPREEVIMNQGFVKSTLYEFVNNF